METHCREKPWVGVMVDGQAWFIPSEKITGVFELETPHGVVKISRSDAGIQVVENLRRSM